MSTPQQEGKLHKQIQEIIFDSLMKESSQPDTTLHKQAEKQATELLKEAKTEIPTREKAREWATKEAKRLGTYPENLEHADALVYHGWESVIDSVEIRMYQDWFQKWLGFDATVPKKEHLNPESNNKQTGEP